MGIYFIDKTHGAKDKLDWDKYEKLRVGSLDLQNWRDYREFKNQVEGNGLINIFLSLFINKDDKEKFREISPKVGILYNNLEQMIQREKIDPTLYAFQADTVIYKEFGETPIATIGFDKKGSYNLYEGEEKPRRSPLGPKLVYSLGLDICLMCEDDWEIAKGLARLKKIRLTSWRGYHGSFVKDIRGLEDPNEILDAVLEFGKIHKKVTSAVITRDLLYRLKNKVSQTV